MMMDMMSAYSVGSFELRLLTYRVQISPTALVKLDEDCLKCFTEHSAAWLEISHGFHICAEYHDDIVQVSFLFSCSL